MSYVRCSVCDVCGIEYVLCVGFGLCYVSVSICVMCSLHARTPSPRSKHASLLSVGKGPTRAQGKRPTLAKGKSPTTSCVMWGVIQGVSTHHPTLSDRSANCPPHPPNPSPTRSQASSNYIQLGWAGRERGGEREIGWGCGGVPLCGGG